MNYTKLTLYKNIQFPRDYSHVLHFSTVAEQKSYFNQASLKYTTFNDFLYIEKTKKIVVNGAKGNLLACNYLSFVNGDNSKVFYAFIDDLIYESDGSTTISYTIDIMQTYMFDYELGNCDVEREHAIRFDSQGKANNANMFTTEPYLCNIDVEYKQRHDFGVVTSIGDKRVFFIVISCTSYLPNARQTAFDNIMLPTYAIPISLDGATFCNEDGNIFATYDDFQEGLLAQQIVGAQLVTHLPCAFSLSNVTNNLIRISGIPTANINNDNRKMVFDISGISFNETRTGGSVGYLYTDSFGNIRPKTDKNLSFENSKENFYKINSSQFKQIGISFYGNIKYLKPELIKEDTRISVHITKTTPMFEYLTIENYVYDNDTSKTLSLFMQNNTSVPIIKDTFYSWLVNSGLSGTLNTIETNVRSGLGSFGGWGALGGAAVGQLKAGEQILQQMIAPDSVMNVNSPITAYLYKEGLDVNVFEASLKNKQIYYNFFNKYGYSCNENKVPNYNTHYWFNYISNGNTSLLNIKNMTHNIIDEIKSIYNNGVTLWHYNNGDYKWIDYDCNNIERSLAT